MAAQSIVDFVRDSLVSGQMTDRLMAAGAPVAMFRQGMNGAQSSASPSPANELAYITTASQVIRVLQDGAAMTARQAFDAAGADDFPAFQSTMQEMAKRGLIRIAGREPRYGDDIYASLAATA